MGVATSSNVWSSLTRILLMNLPKAVWGGSGRSEALRNELAISLASSLRPSGSRLSIERCDVSVFACQKSSQSGYGVAQRVLECLTVQACTLRGSIPVVRSWISLIAPRS